MTWLQLIIPTEAARVDSISDALLELGAASVTLQDAEDQPVLEPAPGTTPIWSHTRLIGLFPAEQDPAAIIGQLQSRYGLSISDWKAEPLEDRDWVRAWMDNFQPMQFGQRLWIIPSGYTPPQPEAINILLDPGLAFGTGTHPTTSMCLEWLDAHPPLDLNVIDYGCGSGILAVAAARLGARHVWAVDNDPQALLATRDNMHKNRITDGITVYLPDALPALQVPLLLANILAGPLITLASRLAGRVEPGGRIVLSGILGSQMDEVMMAYRPFFDIHCYKQQQDWVCLEGTRL
jgi:ribosomal protein L11 methyltransferase